MEHHTKITLSEGAVLFLMIAAFLSAGEPKFYTEKRGATLDLSITTNQASNHRPAPYSFNANRFDNEHVTDWSRDGEFLIDTNIVYVPDMLQQYSPSVAFDGINYLVVWQDMRNGSDNADIYGARVDQAGNVLDPTGIAISTAQGNQTGPSIIFDGTNYLVVWEDERNGSDNRNIYGTRVEQAGNVLDPIGIAISIAQGNQTGPSVSFDGTNYLVVWEDERNDPYSCDIYGGRVDQVGNVLDLSGIAISTAQGNQTGPSVAHDGTSYLVVWQDGRNDTVHFDIYGTRVDTSGSVLAPTGIAIATTADNHGPPSVTFGGAYYLVVWMSTGFPFGFRGARVDTSGIVLDTTGIDIGVGGTDISVTVAFDGINYLVVWVYGDWPPPVGDIRGARVNQDGVVLDSAIAISTLEGDQRSPSVAFGGTNYLVVWRESRPVFNDPDICGTRVNQAGHVLDSAEIFITIVANSQTLPSVAFDGTSYLIVWQNCRDYLEHYDIYGTRVDQFGTVLDPARIAISTAVDWSRDPSVAFDGTNYLVVWEHTPRKIYGARVSQAGVVLDPHGFRISRDPPDPNPHFSPSIAFDGTNYLAVWEDMSYPPPYGDIYGARVDQSGVVLDPGGIQIAATAEHQERSPSVAFDGTDYLVVWRDHHYAFSIYGTRVDQAGNVLNPAGIGISPYGDVTASPSVAFGITDYLVVWHDNRGGSDYNIYCARVDTSGIVLDPTGITITNTQGNQTNPSVAFDGTNYVVVWEDYRNGSSSDIYGAILDISGVVIDTFSVSLQPGDQLTPALAHGVGDQLLITYSGWADSINTHPADAMRIWGKFYPFIGIEEGTTSIAKQRNLSATIFRGPLRLPEGKKCRVFDITGRVVEPNMITRGIYFIEVDGVVTQKVIKIR